MTTPMDQTMTHRTAMPRQSSKTLCACRVCGLPQYLPTMPAPSGVSGKIRQQQMVPKCIRCHATLPMDMHPVQRQRILAIVIAALAIYPAAISLPILKVEQMGFSNTTNIWQGTQALFEAGQWFVGLIVLACSIIFPLFKLMLLLSLLMLSQRWPNRLKRIGHTLVEWTSRWGMLDVLLVAIMVSLIKLGDWVNVAPGIGLLAFTLFVLLSLVASAMFHPHWLWRHGKR